MMKAAVVHHPGRVTTETVELALCGPTDVVIRVKACGICGTDLRIEAGEFLAVYPVTPGHEFSGTVVEVGAQVRHVRAGQPVAVNPNLPCRQCAYCRRGKVHLCENPTACGVNFAGGFAEYCKVPAELAVPLPEGLPMELAAMMEPVSCCLHGMDLAGVVPGDQVVVLGGGSIGLIMLQLARVAGAARVVVSEPLEAKRTLAHELGAWATVDPSVAPEALGETVEELMPGGADVVIEAAGVPATSAAALALARRGGTVLFFGVNSKELELPLSPYDVYHRELTIRGAFTNPLTDTRALALLAAGRLRVAPLITHRFPLAQVREGLDAVRAGETVKALVLPWESAAPAGTGAPAGG
jgi:2-desacetyl-2-hydroxyethyl bacteriochlorophyllide A dehydrogenase